MILGGITQVVSLSAKKQDSRSPILMGRRLISVREEKCPAVSVSYFVHIHSIPTDADTVLLDNGLVCAPADKHAEVLKVVQRVLDSHGPIPWNK